MSDQVKLTCYGVHWARMTLDVDKTQIKSHKPGWLTWFGENEIQRRHGVRMSLKHAEVK